MAPPIIPSNTKTGDNVSLGVGKNKYDNVRYQTTAITSSKPELMAKQIGDMTKTEIIAQTTPINEKIDLNKESIAMLEGLKAKMTTLNTQCQKIHTTLITKNNLFNDTSTVFTNPKDQRYLRVIYDPIMPASTFDDNYTITIVQDAKTNTRLSDLRFNSLTNPMGTSATTATNLTAILDDLYTGATSIPNISIVSIDNADINVPTFIKLTEVLTLNDFIAAVNGATATCGVVAKTIQTSPKSYALILQAAVTGQAIYLNITSSGSSWGDFFTSSNTDPATLQAQITLMDIPISRPTNTFDDVLSGVTFEILQPAPNRTISWERIQNTSYLEENVTTFLTSINTIYTDLYKAVKPRDSGEMGRGMQNLNQIRTIKGFFESLANYSFIDPVTQNNLTLTFLKEASPVNNVYNPWGITIKAGQPEFFSFVPQGFGVAVEGVGVPVFLNFFDALSSRLSSYLSDQINSFNGPITKTIEHLRGDIIKEEEQIGKVTGKLYEKQAKQMKNLRDLQIVQGKSEMMKEMQKMMDKKT